MIVCKRELRRGSMRRHCGGEVVRKLTQRGSTHTMPGRTYQYHVCKRCGDESLRKLASSRTVALREEGID